MLHKEKLQVITLYDRWTRYQSGLRRQLVQATYLPLLGTYRGHLGRFLGESLVPDFYLTPKYPLSSSPFQYSPPQPPPPI